MTVRHLLVAAALLAAPSSALAQAPAQHEGHQPTPAAAGAAEIAQCVQAQAVVARTIDAAAARLETARQTNDPAAMRAAIDDFDRALREVRAQLAPCSQMQAIAAPQAQTSQASGTGGATITFRSTPSPPRGAAENDFEVTVTDRDGKPVDGAAVSLTLYMPAMPAMKMPEMRNEVTLKSAGGGKYTGTGQIMMAGTWMATVIVRQDGKEIGRSETTITAQ